MKSLLSEIRLFFLANISHLRRGRARRAGLRVRAPDAQAGAERHGFLSDDHRQQVRAAPRRRRARPARARADVGGGAGDGSPHSRADFAERRKAHAAGERAQRGAAAGAGLARVARPALFAGAAAAAARARPAAEHEQDAARADGAALCACGSAQGRELFASEQLATFGVEGERAREKPLAWRRAKGPRRQPPRGEQLPAFSRISCRRVLMGA